MSVRIGCVAVLVLLTVACEAPIGDQVRPQYVILYNRTNAVAFVTVNASRRNNPPPDYRLQPGERKESGVAFPIRGRGRGTISATTETGELIFCRVFEIGPGEEPGPPIDVDIVRGEINC